MLGAYGESESQKSVLAERLDDDDDDWLKKQLYSPIRMVLALDNSERLISHKTKKPNYTDHFRNEQNLDLIFVKIAN